MNDNKTKIIVILIFISTIAGFIILFNSKSKTKVEINTEIKRLESNELFNLQRTISDFYTKALSNDEDFIFNVINPNYMAKNSLSKEALIKEFSLDGNITYEIEKVYYNDDARVNYYFIEGYIIYDLIEERYIENDINYLMIVKNDRYYLEPIAKDVDIEKYANEYEIIDIETPKESITKYIFDDAKKMTYYITRYINLFYMDSQRAYNMLGEETKARYKNINDYISKDIDLDSRVKTISIFEKKNQKAYKVTTERGKNIEIIEYYPNEYTIDY